MIKFKLINTETTKMWFEKLESKNVENHIPTTVTILLCVKVYIHGPVFISLKFIIPDNVTVTETKKEIVVECESAVLKSVYVGYEEHTDSSFGRWYRHVNQYIRSAVFRYFDEKPNGITDLNKDINHMEIIWK